MQYVFIAMVSALGSLIGVAANRWLDRRRWRKLEAKAAEDRIAARAMWAQMQEQVNDRLRRKVAN